MKQKSVNNGKWTYFLVSIFGIIVFFGIFLLQPKTVFAPPSFSDSSPSHLSHFGKPLPSSSQEEPSPALEVPPSTRLVFAGDIMLARAVEWKMKSSGAAYPFSLWDASIFGDADAVVGNFEGTVRTQERLEETNVMAFDTLPSYIPALRAAGFTHLSLSNNHADDFGQATTDFTRSTLTEHGIASFGDPFASELFITRIAGDIPVSLLGFHAFNETTDSLLDAIHEEDTRGNFVIVYPHWGNEYEHSPSSAQTTAAEAWIAAGADLIIGAHPHVVQNVAIVDGVPVIYSLGNFLFDQDFSRATQIGAVVDVVITEEDLSFTFSPVEIKRRQMFFNHEEDQTLLTWLGLERLSWTVTRKEVQTP
jgi:poly-gamma-glutamate capsule biosynthesis protein CapA/YwtB (metallophosphatase superfamily)